MTEYWEHLSKRVQYVRKLYNDKNIQLKAGEGLTLALDEAQSCVAAKKSSGAPTVENCLSSANACHVVWALYESIKQCVDAQLDVTNHLRQITTGSTDFGLPAEQPHGNKTIFLKDFEAELFVAAQLAKALLPVTFLDKPNDPRGEMAVSGILIEVKHPNSTKQIIKLMRKFNLHLKKGKAFGVFVTAIEDAFNVAEPAASPNHADFIREQQNKRSQMEKFGRCAISAAASLSNIGAIVQTCSAMESVGDETCFKRRSNSLVFENRQYPDETKEQIERIAKVFNSNFRRYTKSGKIIAPDGPTSPE